MPYGKQPTWDEVKDRFKWNLKNLFSNDNNPYVLHGEGDLQPKERTAREDLFHSLENLLVERKRLKKLKKQGKN